MFQNDYYEGVRRSTQNVCALDVLKMFWQRSSSVLRVITLIIIIFLILSWTKVREVKTDTSDPSTVSQQQKLCHTISNHGRNVQGPLFELLQCNLDFMTTFQDVVNKLAGLDWHSLVLTHVS